MARQKGKAQSKGSTGRNKNLTEDFLYKYRQKEGVFETESGLLYRIVSGSDGEVPDMDCEVKVHHRILLADGSVVDDTYKSGLPDTFTMEEAIEGLQEGIQLMPTGARYEFVIPPELGWGKKGNGGMVGPNAVMIMDIRLLSFS